jgi:hypothetical protein
MTALVSYFQHEIDAPPDAPPYTLAIPDRFARIHSRRSKKVSPVYDCVIVDQLLHEEHQMKYSVLLAALLALGLSACGKKEEAAAPAPAPEAAAPAPAPAPAPEAAPAPAPAADAAAPAPAPADAAQGAADAMKGAADAAQGAADAAKGAADAMKH